MFTLKNCPFLKKLLDEDFSEILVDVKVVSGLLDIDNVLEFSLGTEELESPSQKSDFFTLFWLINVNKLYAESEFDLKQTK